MKRSVQSRLSKILSLTIKEVTNEETSYNGGHLDALSIRWYDARSNHIGRKDVKNDVRPNAKRKDRAIANYENRRRDDDFGADVHGVRRISHLLLNHIRIAKQPPGSERCALSLILKNCRLQYGGVLADYQGTIPGRC